MPLVFGAASKLLDMGTEVEVIAGFQYELNDVPNDGYLTSIFGRSIRHMAMWMIQRKVNERMLDWLQPIRKAIRYLDSFIEDTYLAGKPD